MKKNNTLYMVQLALMAAVTLLMALTPLGYIKTPLLSVTLLTVPVAVAAILLGPVGGAVCGFAFGMTSFVNALLGTGSALLMGLLQINPVLTFVTAVVARVLVGLFTGLIFKALYQIKKTKPFSFYVASLCCPLLNTILFMGFLMLFFFNSPAIQASAEKFGTHNPLRLVIMMVGVQGAIEAGICFVIAGAVSRILYGVLIKSGAIQGKIFEKDKAHKPAESVQ
ncbi:MAG: ECF transporter S component [Lachnospiraceae bacterium]|nr:ECF transporter S component [Lachnospiraceae bacterium]